MDKDIENVTQFSPKPYDKFRNDTGLEEVLRDLVEQQRIANIIALGEHWQKTGYDFADSMAPILRDDIRASLGLD